jgi:1-phosphofructokinase family hexose kinase
MILCEGTTPTVQRSMSFPSVNIDEVNRAVAVLESAAGKSINVARVLHLLGYETLATGFVGGDTGDFIAGEMHREGIPNLFVRVPFRTRTCTTVIDQKNGTTTELVEESQIVENRYWQELLTLIEQQMKGCKVLVLSGSLPPKAPQTFYADCCKIAQTANVPVIMDARGEPLAHAMQYRPVMVKPNRAELATTFALPVETDDQLRDSTRRLIEKGAQSALITMGAKGAVLSDGKQFWFIPAPKVKLSNPIGSGDSVAAGFAAGLVDGLPFLDCAIYGIACGSANAMTPVPGVVHKPDVERLRKEVRVQAWD